MLSQTEQQQKKRRKFCVDGFLMKQAAPRQKYFRFTELIHQHIVKYELRDNGRDSDLTSKAFSLLLFYSEELFYSKNTWLMYHFTFSFWLCRRFKRMKWVQFSNENFKWIWKTKLTSEFPMKNTSIQFIHMESMMSDT